MKKSTDYLLRYISMETYNKIIEGSNKYTLSMLEDNFIDVNLNIKYLINYGISNIDKVIPNIIGDLLLSHKDFEKKIESYEKTLSKEEVIMLIENM